MTAPSQVTGGGGGVLPLARPTLPAPPELAAKPTLVFAYSATSGASRRAEGFLAQVLQRRRNHDTFTVRRLNFETHPELAERLGIEGTPAIVVIEARRVRARLERPRGCVDITETLAPWLK